MLCVSDFRHNGTLVCGQINFCNAFKSNCALMFYIGNYNGRKCLNYLLHLEPCNVMFIVISDMMAHWNIMLNTIIFEFNFCNGKKVICSLIFIISNRYGRKCLSNFVHLECCRVVFKVISDNFNAQMNCALMFIICNHIGRKCLTNL